MKGCYSVTCESVNRDIMADLFSGSSSNLHHQRLSSMWWKYCWKCRKIFRPFHQKVWRESGKCLKQSYIIRRQLENFSVSHLFWDKRGWRSYDCHTWQCWPRWKWRGFLRCLSNQWKSPPSKTYLDLSALSISLISMYFQCKVHLCSSRGLSCVWQTFCRLSPQLGSAAVWRPVQSSFDSFEIATLSSL